MALPSFKEFLELCAPVVYNLQPAPVVYNSPPVSPAVAESYSYHFEDAVVPRKITRLPEAKDVQGFGKLVRKDNDTKYQFTGIPAPEIARDLKDVTGFGVLIRRDRNGPGTSHGNKLEYEFECDRCGIDETPIRRQGPNGKRTLCNGCGIRWAREQKKKEERRVRREQRRAQREQQGHMLA